MQGYVYDIFRSGFGGSVCNEMKFIFFNVFNRFCDWLQGREEDWRV